MDQHQTTTDPNQYSFQQYTRSWYEIFGRPTPMKAVRILVSGLFALFLSSVALPSVTSAYACSSDLLCPISDGAYRIVPPNTKPRSELGAIFFFHGFTGSALETVSDEGLVEIARKQGGALVALEGLGGRRFLPGVAEPKRDEIEYSLGFLEAPMLSKRGLTF
jgi:hypothetical protein